MKHFSSVLIAVFLLGTFALGNNNTAPYSFCSQAFAGTIQAGGVFLSTSKQDNQNDKSGVKKAMHIQVNANGNITVFELNDSRSASDLFAQLPLNIKVEDYSDNEKIFFPPQKLRTKDTPQANARRGTLAYYAPWGDVVMFYKDFGSARGLYELGHAISGLEFIQDLSGSILIEKVEP